MAAEREWNVAVAENVNQRHPALIQMPIAEADVKHAALLIMFAVMARLLIVVVVLMPLLIKIVVLGENVKAMCAMTEMLPLPMIDFKLIAVVLENCRLF